MDADWTWACRAWEKWTAKHVGSSVAGMPVKAALLLNYDPTGPSRLLPIVRNNLQTEFFSIGPNQYLVTSIHEHWFCARCVNTTQPGGEGVIVMQIGAYLLVSMQWWLLISLHGTSTGEHINFLWCRLMALQCSV
ncbi:uncharacterized protein [Triticum aestivum]|uniref:uncharacterized protein isoform X5 n=1 Tax=Triticum aestivum TaxID=4565 RepID=UPI001D01A1AA|nr:uncharacterized protein LOC123081863 isoform X5 [Triticum aestivum]